MFMTPSRPPGVEVELARALVSSGPTTERPWVGLELASPTVFPRLPRMSGVNDCVIDSSSDAIGTAPSRCGDRRNPNALVVPGTHEPLSGASLAKPDRDGDVAAICRDLRA